MSTFSKNSFESPVCPTRWGVTDTAEISTQVTNNWSQAILASYMSEEHWGVAGFIRWLCGRLLPSSKVGLTEA